MALRRRGVLLALTLAVLPGLAVGTGTGWSIARMTASRSVAGNSFTTAASFDTVAPTVSATVIAKTGQYFDGFIRQAGTYYVYANATDGGVVPSGIATIKADVSAITTGSTAVALAAGSFTVKGVTYGYRSAALTAKNPLTAGAKSYSLTSTDNNANVRTQSGFTVTIDNTVPTATDIQTADGGATAGTIEPGDTITWTFSELIDPESILAGWTGTTTNVVVRFTDNAGNDTYAVWNAVNTTQLSLGSVNTKGNYMTTDLTAGASGTPSTMVLNGATNTLTISLGTVAGTIRNDNNNNKAVWTPSSGAFDQAGNAMSTTNRTETGTNDKDF